MRAHGVIHIHVIAFSDNVVCIPAAFDWQFDWKGVLGSMRCKNERLLP